MPTGLAPDAVDARLTALVRERDDGRCLLTPRNTTQIHDPIALYIIPPKLCAVLGQPPSHTERCLLEAFLSPDNADALRVALDRDQTTTDNALLLAPSAAHAFWGGELYIKNYRNVPPPARYSQVGLQTASKFLVGTTWNKRDKKARRMRADSNRLIQYGFGSSRADKDLEGCDGKSIERGYHARDLETKSPSRLPLPSLFLLGLQEKFGYAKGQFSIEEETLKPWPAAATPSKLQTFDTATFR